MSGGTQDFSRLLRLYRASAHLTQEELAERAAVSSRTIRDIERGAVRAPRKSSVEAIADALDLSGQAREIFLEAAQNARWREADTAEAPTRQDSAPQYVPRQLPAGTPFFTGRADELHQLGKNISETPDLRAAIVAIVGTAGVGKTALALHWAHQLADRFADGQLYVDLRGYDSEPVRPIEALARFLRALGVSSDRIPIGEDEATNLYRSMLAKRRLLVLVDNARSAEQVRPFLPGAGVCLLIVTSRSSLTGLVAHDGARRVGLDALPAGDALELLTHMLGRERVEAEREAVLDLGRLCGFLPLPLRIAAANLASREHQSVRSYVATLTREDPLAEFAIAGDGSNTVRTVFDQSYAALTPGEQRMFRLTGLAPGPDISVDAAAVLIDVSYAEADRLLRGLAAAHMVTEDAYGRYSFHDLLRAYARQRAASLDADRGEALTRLFEWYLDTTIAAAETLYPERVRLPLDLPVDYASRFGDRQAAIAWLNAERADLVAVVHHTAEHGPAPISWQLVDALRGYFWLGSPGVEWLGCAEAALHAAHVHDAADGVAAAQLGVAQLYLHQGRHHDSLEAYRDSLAAMRKAKWYTGEVVTLSHLGNVHIHAGLLADAEEYHGQALSTSRMLGRGKGEAFALHGLARLANVRGDTDRAVGLVLEAHELFLEIEDSYGQAQALIDLAVIHHDAGDQAAAMDAISDVMRIAAELRQPVVEARAFNILGRTCRSLERHRESVGHHEQALRLASGIGSKVHEADGLLGLAETSACLGDLDEARRLAESALRLCCDAGYRLLEGEAYEALATISVHLGDRAGARAHAGCALTLHRETGYHRAESRVLATGLIDQARRA
jgi:tetratricopeptide (TPR) repeat protein/transcriptional regulator with XRE-family HTH domain